MDRIKTGMLTILVLMLAISFSEAPMKAEEVKQEPVDSSRVHDLGWERFREYVDQMMDPDGRGYAGVLSFQVNQTTIAFRAGRPGIFVCMIDATGKTQESAIPIAWGAVIRDDGSGNCTVLEEGPYVNGSYLNTYTSP